MRPASAIVSNDQAAVGATAMVKFSQVPSSSSIEAR